MFKKEELLELIAMRLAHLKAYVSTINSIHLFNVNVVAEDFFASFLNVVLPGGVKLEGIPDKKWWQERMARSWL